MSQPGAQHPSTPDESPKSGEALEIVSIDINKSQAKISHQEGLSQDQLNQVTDKINADFQENKDPNWRVETNGDETKVKVDLD
ncbi:hypothetical protein PL8927_900120 [Planktothrix serta PCC 8927]|uniref:Uncharacterized protein n=1 Tax=Planktothrix serta PCC 8927 TaxID=671068 RepID=A0A7Z9BZS4_9CYAN|nr:hypothetical protein [Planktothrix serta]VXD25832.1 hypothetical protein PL8927_900120 [Planktothrix serta PCC 8927]